MEGNIYEWDSEGYLIMICCIMLTWGSLYQADN